MNRVFPKKSAYRTFRRQAGNGGHLRFVDAWAIGPHEFHLVAPFVRFSRMMKKENVFLHEVMEGHSGDRRGGVDCSQMCVYPPTQRERPGPFLRHGELRWLPEGLDDLLS